MKTLVILGTGGGVYDVLDIVEAINAIAPTWRVGGFLDDARPAGGEYLGFPVLGGLGTAGRVSDVLFINCIGSDRSFRGRPEIAGRTGVPAERFATLVHPQASVSSWGQVGRGSYVSFGASVGGGAVVGDHVCLGPGVIVGHDSVIEAHAVLAPGAVVSGHVRVGRACYVGARAVVRQNLNLGDGALIGMGAVVTRDVPEGWVVAGNPARRLLCREVAGELASVAGR